MNTISIGLNVGLDVEKLKNSSRPNKYEVKLILGKVMKKDMPKRGDIMLLSKRGLKLKRPNYRGWLLLHYPSGYLGQRPCSG